MRSCEVRPRRCSHRRAPPTPPGELELCGQLLLACAWINFTLGFLSVNDNEDAPLAQRVEALFLGVADPWHLKIGCAEARFMIKVYAVTTLMAMVVAFAYAMQGHPALHRTASASLLDALGGRRFDSAMRILLARALHETYRTVHGIVAEGELPRGGSGAVVHAADVAPAPTTVRAEGGGNVAVGAHPLRSAASSTGVADAPASPGGASAPARSQTPPTPAVPPPSPRPPSLRLGPARPLPAGAPLASLRAADGAKTGETAATSTDAKTSTDSAAEAKPQVPRYLLAMVLSHLMGTSTAQFMPHLSLSFARQLEPFTGMQPFFPTSASGPNAF